MRFTGNIDAKTDEKGRVFLPSIFRKVMRSEDEEGLVLRRDLFVKCLVLYPKKVWEAQVDAIRARTNPFDRRQREAMRLFTADAENITLDSGGRMLIPRRYLEHAEIKATYGSSASTIPSRYGADRKPTDCSATPTRWRTSWRT